VSARAQNPALGTLSHMALLTLQEIEKIFKISRSTLYRMRNEGGFPPGIQVRGRWRWKAIDIQAFIERSKATSSRESCMVSPQYQGAVARGPRRLRVA
jgi:predicted DNA-binding transcriptional regulator AlpA